ncbi:MAG: hypothetical protein AABY22_09640 [Nanoarchaeota archaeon]
MSIIIVLILLILTTVSLYYVIKNINPSPIVGEGCNIINQTEGANINILFFGKETQVKEYINYFLSKSPYNENKDSFNFYYIDQERTCEIYKGIAILCYSRDLIRQASICPNNFIIVLQDYPTSIRSSNYINVMSININHPKNVILHEFGHSFINLAEEYVPAAIPRNSAGNCVQSCIEFNGKENGCYQGCSEANYYRSVENGIMRTLRSENYGNFNTYLINKTIDDFDRKIIVKQEAFDENLIYTDGINSAGELEGETFKL